MYVCAQHGDGYREVTAGGGEGGGGNRGGGWGGLARYREVTAGGECATEGETRERRRDQVRAARCIRVHRAEYERLGWVGVRGGCQGWVSGVGVRGGC